MRPLTDSAIIAVWERGLGSTSATRAWLMLSSDGDDAAPSQLAQLPVGRRDARLLELREQTFGPLLPCLAACPACHENLECNLNTGDLLSSVRADNVPSSPSWLLQVGDYQIQFRLPDSRDLAGLSPDAEVAHNRAQLLQACLLSARRGDMEIPATALPVEVEAAVVNRMAELDPEADLQLKLDCPECGHQWNAPFDIVSFFWAELQAAATRALREVHELASAYGWSETGILSMTPRRRQAYLEMLRA